MYQAVEADAFFVLSNGLYHPTEVQRSPWNPSAQNGVGIGGLLMHLVEQIPGDGPMLNARMTIDIQSATAFAPTEGSVCVVRSGKRLQIVEATLAHEGNVTARGRLLRIRAADTPSYSPGDFPHAGPEGLPERPRPLRVPLMQDAMETRLARGLVERSGRNAIWQRLRWNLVAGSATSPMVHAAMMSDYGHGISNPIDRSRWNSPNVDISMHMARAPEGEWLALYAETILGGTGAGLTNMTLADANGVFGYAHQSLYVAPI